eukprot:Skav226225  [mRNA]  locus=scaffold1218:212734:213051:- [translate_table: standard]
MVGSHNCWVGTRHQTKATFGTFTRSEPTKKRCGMFNMLVSKPLENVEPRSVSRCGVGSVFGGKMAGSEPQASESQKQPDAALTLRQQPKDARLSHQEQRSCQAKA